MVSKKQSIPPASNEETSNQDPRSGRRRLFVMSEVRLLRDGLVLALSQQPSVFVVGSSDLSVSPTDIAELRPDVVLLDASERGNLEVSPALCQILPSAKIVAFAVADVGEDIIACAEAGISGYIPHTGSIEDVISAVHAAVCGELHCSPQTSALLFGYLALLSGKQRLGAGHDVLTRREKEIATLLEKGLSNKEIARSLRVGTATVKNHVHSILTKLQVPTRLQAGAWLRRANARTLRKAIFEVFVTVSAVANLLWVVDDWQPAVLIVC
jgi:two-component system nitrate/nitrite response regulator NarL